jgi:rRNA-processing protein FCF1
MDVLCDTSFLIIFLSVPIKQLERIEFHFGKLNLLVPDAVIKELKQLEKKAGPKRSKLASTAIEICCSRFKIVQVSKSNHVDDSLIEYAMNHKCAIATIDTRLRRRCITNNVPVITLNRNRLTIARTINRK